MTRCGIWIVAIVAMLGCGGGKSGGMPPDGATDGGLTGTLNGLPFVVRDAVIATTLNWKSSLYPGTSTLIILADTTGLCDQIQTNLTKAGSQQVIFDLAEAGAATANPVTGPGTFPFSNDLSLPRAAFGVYTHTDPQCVFSDLVAVSGSVTLTEVAQSADSARGSSSVVFEGGGSLSGDFSVANACPTSAVDTYLNKNPTCM